MPHVDGRYVPTRLCIDGEGYAWMLHDDQPELEGMWSMARINPDNSPIPEPKTFYIPVDPNEPHVIEFRTWDWTLRHPLHCRVETGLFDCEYNRVAELMDEPPIELGRFAVAIEDGELKILHTVDE